ncbi:MAG TPA: glycogen debranching enzyme N-terminal domain-containing protein [Chloroflexota bacterium]
MAVCLERDELVNPSVSIAHEWRLPNGSGGYAAGTAAGANSRSSHGLLVAATDSRQRVLVAKVDEEVELDERDDGERIALATNEYHDGTLHPTGHLYLEGWVNDGARVGWRWRVRDVGLEKTIAVAQDQNRTIVRYRLFESAFPLRLRLTPFLADRAPDACTRGALEWRWLLEPRAQGVIARSGEGAMPVGLFAWRGRSRADREPGRFVETGIWYWRFLHRADRGEGRDYLDDLYAPGLLAFDLRPGEGVWLALTAEPDDLAEPERIDPELDLAAASRPASPEANGSSNGPAVTHRSSTVPA